MDTAEARIAYHCGHRSLAIMRRMRLVMTGVLDLVDLVSDIIAGWRHRCGCYPVNCAVLVRDGVRQRGRHKLRSFHLRGGRAQPAYHGILWDDP